VKAQKGIGSFKNLTVDKGVRTLMRIKTLKAGIVVGFIPEEVYPGLKHHNILG
jgi:hypothetical protein